MNVWKLTLRVSQHEPRTFWAGWFAFVVFFTLPAAVGWVLGRGFTALSEGDARSVYRWAAVLALVEVLRMASVHVGAILWTKAWVHMETLLRANLLIAQVASGGVEAGRPVGSAGGALTHFRDDTEDVVNLVDGVIDVSGGVVFTVVAAFVLGAADLTAAAVLAIPLAGVALATRTLDRRIKEYRSADRVATAAVTGFVGDAMAAATTVKVNGATPWVTMRMRGLVDRRRHTAVRDRVLDEGVQAFSRGASDVGLGLVLLVSASAIASGRFDVGTLALFTAYLGWLNFLPRMVGRVLARRKQAGVAFDRMRHLVADDDVTNTVAARSLPIGPHCERSRPPDVRPDREPLEQLDVVGLSVAHGSNVVLHDAHLTIRRGEFVVLSGPIGSGKTTLLRALLGLERRAAVSGEIRWNGFVVTDPSAFMVPPNVGFLPQVPQLLSDTVADNIGLGPVTAVQIERAVALAVFADDLAEFPEGTDTLIGPRGLRLSGGQRQRLAAARAFVHAPEIVVLDDLSSALDVETELLLWRQLAEAGITVLAVSHRAVAFDRADQVLRLDRGRLIG
ncbi:ABC transporter ATP-binding protein [soil metagenome]